MKARVRGGNLSTSVKEDIRKTFLNCIDKYNYDAALQILYILRFKYGWGEKRLTEFAKELTEMQKEIKEHFELEDDDTPWICEIKLKESGIDVKKILKGG